MEECNKKGLKLISSMGMGNKLDPTIIPYGTKVYIPQFDEYFIAEDCGGGIKGNKIDIFMNSESQCDNWGKRSIDIYIVE